MTRMALSDSPINSRATEMTSRARVPVLEMKIRDDEIEVDAIAQQLESFGRAGCGHHAITLDLEQDAHRIEHARFVFDQQQVEIAAGTHVRR